jgi:cation diffusion facilitator family transporter
MPHDHIHPVPHSLKNRKTLIRYAWLSIAAAVVTIVLKTTAFWITGSVGLLSDAMESGVNLMAAFMALAVLTIAARPADDGHHYGHSKAEYFSSGVEGALIVIAALAIGIAAVERLLNPQPVEQAGLGLLIAIIAAVINGVVARILLHVGRQYDSITLIADAQHLMTDVWTSFGVVVAVGLVALTGWQILDPLIALAVAVNILWTGYRLFVKSIRGLMDSALPNDEHRLVLEVLERYQALHPEIDFHALRTRQAASRRFISVHVLVPGAWSVKQGHDVANAIETEIQTRLVGSSVITHLEPIDDPISYEDVDIDREREADS